MLPFLCLTLLAYTQDTFTGQLIDQDTKEALAYVNIGIIGKGVGTVSNMEGYFELPLKKEFDAEFIQLSMIGYASKRFGVAEFREMIQLEPVITLAQTISDLDEVLVSSSAFTKEKILGNKTTSTNMTGGFSTDELGNEVGLVIKIKKSPSYIKDFNVSIARNDYGTIKFRLNFYTVKKGMPDKTLLKENIFVTTDIQTGVLTVDLTPYNIVVEDDFFVSLEWIEAAGEDGLYFSARLFGRPLIHRNTSQANWEKLSPVGLGMTVTTKY